MIRAVGYIRVSTEGQAEKGISLDAQRAKIEAYAALKDLPLVEIIEDAGISAKNMNRPGMHRLMEMVNRKQVDAVIILKLDRMFRSTVDALQTAKLFDRKGIALHSIQENLDTQSAMGRFFFTLLASIAELERGITGERTSSALNRKRERGEALGGHMPYGYRKEGKLLVVDNDEQAILAHMRKIRDLGKTYQQVADELNNMGISTRRGTPWNRVQVFKTIQNAVERPTQIAV